MHNAFSIILGLIGPVCLAATIERAPKQASFPEATRQAQMLLSAALNTR
jgi:hypothetical protein